MMGGDDKGARMANVMAVVAGRAARPCDVCARKRSRWYCAADEAYLCEGCDSSVHAANALALRHERVRLTPNGAPMKMDRRINSSEHLSSVSKKKLKSRPSAPVGRSGATAAFHDKYVSEHTHSNANGLREVKVESNPSNGTTDIDPSDDHFTAEELTGNANLLDDTPSMCPPHYDNPASNPDSHNVISEADFDQFLVSDPNDPNNTTNWGDHDRLPRTPNSAGGGGDVVDEDDDEDDDGGHGVGDDWMQVDPDFSNRGTLSDDGEYGMVPVALPAAGGSAFGRSLALYSHDEKPTDGSCGLPTSSTRVGKPFKNIAGHSEWVKLEEGYSNHEQALSNTTTSTTTTTTTSTCKIELSLNECDLRQVPSLRLNYDDVLSSWPGRDFRWADDGSGSQLVPGDDSNSDAMGSCYDLGLVPDLSSGGCGVDVHGHAATMYGGCGGVVGGNVGGDDSMTNTGNAREVRVNRYREKRRTRLFSKKIRYEVRKLNAERRPRMKGRFVKRSPGREA